MFKYYNQYDYKTTPYWNASHPSATIATAGCGLCCASMVLSAFGITVTPPAMAKIAEKIGARVTTGTDMIKLSSYIKSEYSLTMAKYDDVGKLRTDIKNGKIAIANVGGDRTGYKGVFSNSGHYIVVYGMKDGDPIIYDSGFYQNKYDSSYRSTRVTIGGNHQLYTSWNILNQDCSNRSPRYYVFGKEEKKMTVEEAKKIIQEKCGLSDKTMLYLWSYRYGDDLLLKLARAIEK